MSAESILSSLVRLVRGYMQLETDQVVVYNQDWKIPSDDRLYITVGFLASRPYASGTSTAPDLTDPENPKLVETVTINVRDLLSIEIYSVSEEAVLRKNEVLMAMASTAAQQLCERLALKLGKIPDAFNDLSGVEGAARLNRYNLSIPCLYAESKTAIVEYFDKFTVPPAITVNP